MQKPTTHKTTPYGNRHRLARGMLVAEVSELSLRGRMIPDATTGRHKRYARAPAGRSRRSRRFERLTADGIAASNRTEVDDRSRRISRVEEVALRVFNMIVAAVALVLLSPIILIIAVLIRIDSPGPVFYDQVRVGLDRRTHEGQREAVGRRVSDIGGKPFEILKFRTMTTNAEESSGPVWASDDDPRVTRVGRILRRTRLDEIPQFWNVLRGEMSIVGPRPERPAFVQQLREEIEGYPLRQQVPPGITGWAQINRPADKSVDDVRQKVDFDLEYLDRRSVWFDLWIMLKTVPVMFERDNDCRPQ